MQRAGLERGFYIFRILKVQQFLGGPRGVPFEDVFDDLGPILDTYLFPSRPAPNPSEQAFVDLYCGPGGLSTGMEQYFSVAAAVDSEADPCATYRINHRNARVYQMKIRNFLLKCVPRDFDGVTIRASAGVIGGPPCQGFSVLNKNAIAEQQAFSARVKQMRVMTSGIGLLKPTWAVIENVASVPRWIKLRTVAALRHLGYKVESRVIHASDYGSVQIRRRWITIAHKHKFVFPRPLPVTRKAADILSNNPGQSEIDPRPETLAAIQKLPAGRWVNLPGQNYKVYYVVEPDKLLPAVVNPTKLRYIRPDRSGYLSKAELARAQGFPAGYQIVGNLSSWGQQLANAVPTELGRAIGAALTAKSS